MTIIKKSGRKETFSSEKLLNSIAAASDEAKQPLNKSDLNTILVDFQQIVKGKDLITTQQIDVIVNGLLYSKGYFGILEKYVSYYKRQANN